MTKRCQPLPQLLLQLEGPSLTFAVPGTGPTIVPRFELPGFKIQVTPMTEADVVDLILGHAAARTGDENPLQEKRSGLTLGNVNLRGARLYYQNDAFHEFTAQADYVVLDGFPLWLAARFRSKKYTCAYRVGSTDWLFELLARNPKINIVALAGTSESARLAQREAAHRAPNVTWSAYDGYEFRAQGTTTESNYQVALAGADLILVGLGMPKQEEWIQTHRVTCGTALVANVGGCLDYLAGVQAHAPRWLGRMGLEWMYRLSKSPLRLADRVFLDPLIVTGILLRNRLRSRVIKSR